jgi:hypothetical protein
VLWGNLKEYEIVINTSIPVFWDAYVLRKLNRKHIGDLPLEARGWRFTFIETPELWAVLSYRPFGAPGIAVDYEIYAKSEWEILECLTDIEDIIKHFQLVPICCAPKIMPAEPASGYLGRTYLRKVHRFFKDWAESLADEHMTMTHPSFEQALERMTMAYAKLFELEQILRIFIEQVLAAKYPHEWWNQIPVDIRNQAERIEKRPTNQWLEDYSTSRLRFTELDHLRQIILNRWSDFRDILENQDWFNDAMQYLSRPRHRIAHVNTLTENDFQLFLSTAGKVLMLIRPHTRL